MVPPGERCFNNYRCDCMYMFNLISIEHCTRALVELPRKMSYAVNELHMTIKVTGEFIEMRENS